MKPAAVSGITSRDTPCSNGALPLWAHCLGIHVKTTCPAASVGSGETGKIPHALMHKVRI